MFGSECDFGGPKTTYCQHFSTTSQLNGKFNGQYLRNETRYRQSVWALETTRVPLHRLIISWTLVHKRLKIWPEFLPLRKFCIPHHCQASHTEIRNRTRPNKDFSTVFQNFANFGSQRLKIGPSFYPPSLNTVCCIMSGFAKGDHWAELNHILRHVGQWAKFTKAH